MKFLHHLAGLVILSGLLAGPAAAWQRIEAKLQVHNTERVYWLYTPNNFDPHEPLPLVMILHGGNSNLMQTIQISKEQDRTDRNQFLAVFPQGTKPRVQAAQQYTWNAGKCCGYARRKKVDDVAYLRAVVDDIAANYATVDARRIYAVGISNGGMMAYRLYCEASDLFAAIASISGTLAYEKCKPAKPLPVMHIHGTADRNVPFEGGEGTESKADVKHTSVPETMKRIAQLNGCGNTPKISKFTPRTELRTYHCRRADLELVVIPGGEHTWPGSDVMRKYGGDFAASDVVLDFFAAHPKPK